MTMADKIVVMNSGKVEQIGAPLDLYDHPANLFVAGFIGSPAMNFLKGRIDGGAFQAEAGIHLPLPTGSPPSESRFAIYGIRPEHFRLRGDGLPAKVHVVEPTGSETQVMAEFAGTPIICAFRERLSARPGDEIHIVADPSLVHLFDAGTGQRLNA
jgi:multiple sugar transport system ATP-binding protein